MQNCSRGYKNHLAFENLSSLSQGEQNYLHHIQTTSRRKGKI